MSINDFRDFVKNVLNSSLHVLIPQSVQRAKTLSIQLQSARQKQNEDFINKSYLFKNNSKQNPTFHLVCKIFFIY